MRTIGIVRLLSGGRLSLHPEDKAELMKSDVWEPFSVAAGNSVAKKFDEYDPLTVADEDTFLWSPFADEFSRPTVARNYDGSPYPSYAPPINNFFKVEGFAPWEEREGDWRNMIALLGHVKNKGVILYPPDSISAGSAGATEKLIEGIRKHNDRAVEIFSTAGWKIFSPKDTSHAPSDYWAHYTTDAVSLVHDEVAREFHI